MLLEDVDSLPDNEEKLHEKRLERLHTLMTATQTVPDEFAGFKIVRTNDSAHFMNNITSYNNALSFTSEGTDNTDRRMGWSTYRIQGSMYHMMGSLSPERGVRPAFCQIYTIDRATQQWEERLHLNQESFDNNLRPDVLRMLQQLLADLNPYAVAFKDCATRLRDMDHDPHTRMHIHQNDPARRTRGTHNKPTSNEIASVIVAPEEGHTTKDRDIIVETIGGSFFRVPYWHSCYFAVRYPLLFPFGEQSWHDRLPLRGHNALPTNHLLAGRESHPGVIQNHGLRTNYEPMEENQEAQENRPPQENQLPQEAVNDRPRGRGGSVRVTMKQLYCSWMQVSKYLQKILMVALLIAP